MQGFQTLGLRHDQSPRLRQIQSVVKSSSTSRIRKVLLNKRQIRHNLHSVHVTLRSSTTPHRADMQYQRIYTAPSSIHFSWNVHPRQLIWVIHTSPPSVNLQHTSVIITLNYGHPQFYLAFTASWSKIQRQCVTSAASTSVHETLYYPKDISELLEVQSCCWYLIRRIMGISSASIQQSALLIF